jgi:hypothetical protein
MEVRGLPLPTALVQAVQDGRTKWMFQARVNAHGDELDCLEIELLDFETMREDTPDTWTWFTPGTAMEYESSDETSWLPYIHELSQLVVFGQAGNRLIFCLDYREDRHEPRVICWNWSYWRRVAPNFAAFMDLLEPYEREKFWQHARELSGFPLPEAFVQLCEAIRRDEAPDKWEPREDVDADGHPYETSELLLFTEPDVIAQETRSMHCDFREDDRLQHDEEERHQPGFIQDFTGVDNYVQFGKSETGEPFCFDFGADPKEPSVVTWADSDCYWRRLAPNLTAFMALFVPLGERDRSEEIALLDEGDEGRVRPMPRYALEFLARVDVLASREGARPLFFQLADCYAKMSPEERREVEAELREELEREGMTDDQRRRLDELWSRLRATEPA